MSARSPVSPILRLTALAVAALVSLPGARLAAQQDSGAMQHDSAMTDHDAMAKDKMDKDKMGKDQMAKDQMDKDKMGKDQMDKGQMMGHDSAMGPNMMFMGAEGGKASGDYEVVEAGGKTRLKLTDDFSVESAPDLYLVLTKGPAPDRDALYIGKLKRASGGQTFDLPKGKDVSGYTTLLVWSKKEARAVATAEWHPSSGGAMEHM